MNAVPTVVRFANVTRRFARGTGGVQKVSFGLARGEFVFLTGPSGAGKSTILKLARLEELPESGEVRVAGATSLKITRGEIAKVRRKIGSVFQDFRLLEDRTAFDNVAFALEVTGAPAAGIGARVQKALERVGLTSKLQAYPGELSGGEQQRVAIARALVNDPLVVLADEPTGNLDERASRAVFQLLRDINAGGTSVLMATHDLDLVRASGFRTLELNRGTLAYDSAEAGPMEGLG
ncbi:MAG: ATP-binding cassette domain-containing protein [Gemmatimonadaceae bacterium]|nr:ATP-binding cassette domain-containing protein [Gemmatimonadaceae bacterium]